MVNSMNEFDNEVPEFSTKLQAYSNCLMAKISRDNVIEKLFAFNYLGEKELSELEKDKLQAEFMLIHISISYEAKGCASGLGLT
jgi:hypothetical protein